MLAVGGLQDHVHLLTGISGSQRVSDVVREVKKASSVWAKREYSGFEWQVGYAALSIGYGDCPRVVSYIANQEAHHLKRSSADELRELLEEFVVEYDPRYFF